MKTGRPTTYTEERGEEICRRIANGESLRAICRDKEMPDKETVRQWRRKDEQFRARYAQARIDQAESHVDRMLDYCNELEVADGREMTKVQALRVASENLRWIAGVQNPRIYGDLQKLELTGKEGGELQIVINRPQGRGGEGGDGDD